MMPGNKLPFAGEFESLVGRIQSLIEMEFPVVKVLE